ncbi:MAG: hypothetical protein CL609_24505 [Anaerolineaceae bacterium]|nr:hypothetical protein [Anaerolineaceae bacterium]
MLSPPLAKASAEFLLTALSGGLFFKRYLPFRIMMVSQSHPSENGLEGRFINKNWGLSFLESK